MKAHQAGSAPVKGPGKALLEAMLALRSEQEVTRRGTQQRPFGARAGWGPEQAAPVPLQRSISWSSGKR